MRVRHLVPLTALVALLVPVGANASTMIDRNAHGVTLKVNSAGQALVSYTRARQALERARVGRGQRDCADGRRQAGRFQARLLGRLGHLQEERLEDLREHVRRRTPARRSPGA